MKKECQRTRQALPKYLHGHLFKTSQVRIGRHLQQCVICRSEFEALRRTEETRQILKDIDAPEGVVDRMRERVASLGKLKKLLYRPLWIMGLVLVAAAVYYYVVTPRQLDLEIEKIVKTAPSGTAVTSAASGTTPSTSLAQPASRHAAASAPAMEPLVVTITPENDDAAIQRINEIMRGHGQMRKLTFSDAVKEIEGSLTSKELLTFFSRIDPVAKVNYSRKRFKSFKTAEPIPFVLKLKAAPMPLDKSLSPAQPAQKPVGAPADEAAVPAPLATAPSQSATR